MIVYAKSARQFFRAFFASFKVEEIKESHLADIVVRISLWK
jgi:hypothetical protein